jgi:hypothetical protein
MFDLTDGAVHRIMRAGHLKLASDPYSDAFAT